eukprot:429486-Amphidinium_carterae.1
MTTRAHCIQLLQQRQFQELYHMAIDEQPRSAQVTASATHSGGRLPYSSSSRAPLCYQRQSFRRNEDAVQ